MNLPTPIAAIDKHRLAALQDGVYAIAMTLLVLELRLPTVDNRGFYCSGHPRDW